MADRPPSTPSPTPSRTGNAARLAIPAVGERIRATVRGRLPDADVPDVVQGTYLRALVAPKLPDDLDGLLRLVSTIARGLVVDFHRAQARRARRVDDGAEPDEVALEDAPTSAREPAAVREMLEWVESEVASGHVPPDVPRWARELASGATYEEIAEREGKTVSAVKVAIHRARKHLHRRWQAYASAATLGAVLAVWIYAAREPVGESAGNPYVERRSAQEEAQRLREEAFAACNAAKWGECLRLLDESKDRDPEGERSPQVRADRERARQALEPRRRSPDGG